VERLSARSGHQHHQGCRSPSIARVVWWACAPRAQPSGRAGGVPSEPSFFLHQRDHHRPARVATGARGSAPPGLRAMCRFHIDSAATGVAVPVHDPRGRVIASRGVVVPNDDNARASIGILRTAALSRTGSWGRGKVSRSPVQWAGHRVGGHIKREHHHARGRDVGDAAERGVPKGRPCSGGHVSELHKFVSTGTPVALDGRDDGL
jgi:hypothetical protein